jgi:hypothetical protein
MSEILVKNVVKRESGFLYFVDAKGNVCRATMSRGGRKKSPKKK